MLSARLSTSLGPLSGRMLGSKTKTPRTKWARNLPRSYSSQTSSKPTVGWIGTGVMGKSMCSHLMKAGYKMHVYSRTKSKCDSLVEAGASWHSTAASLAKESDIIFSIVGFPTDVKEVLLGTEGAISTVRPGSILVDMTTSSPALAKEIASAAAKKKCASIDAPVSGGDVGAKNATLSIMIGGESQPIERVMPLFQVMGKTIKVMGGVGAGQHTKMANQILIATTMIGMVEGLLYAQRAGLDLNETIAAVGAGAAGSWSINNYGPRLVKGDIAPGFMVEHFVKDLKIALDESAAMGLKLPGLELAHSLYTRLMDMGHSRSGTHSLMLALADMNKVSFQASGPWVTKKD